jgi:hypothetical protein
METAQKIKMPQELLTAVTMETAQKIKMPAGSEMEIHQVAQPIRQETEFVRTQGLPSW